MCINVEKATAKSRRQLKKAIVRCNMWTFRYLDEMEPLYVECGCVHVDGSFGTRTTPLIEQVNLGFSFWFATALYERCDVFRKVNEFGMYRSISQSKFNYLRELEEKILLARDHVNDIANELDFYEEFQPSLFGNDAIDDDEELLA